MFIQVCSENKIILWTKL